MIPGPPLRLLPRALALALVLPAAACGRDASAGGAFAGSIDTLAGGAVRVKSPARGMWKEGQAWTLAEELRIGAEDGTGPEVLSRVGALEVDPMGRIYVLEPQANEIRVFGADGRHVRTVGRKGGGPGELDNAVGLEWDREGRLWTLDQGNSRFSVFDTAGTFVTSHIKDGGLFTSQWIGGITRAGELYTAGMRMGTDRLGLNLVLVRYDPAGAPRDTFAIPRYEGPSYRHETRRGKSTSRMMTDVPFAPQMVSDFGADGTFWGGVSDRYRLAQTTLRGDTLRIVEREWTPAPVSGAERKEEEEGLKWMMEQGARLDLSRIPSTKPAFARVFTDDQGYLWVQPNLAAEENGKVLDVFDPEGRYLGAVRSPVKLSSSVPVLVRGNQMYTVVMDEMEIPYVVRFRIQGRPTSR